MKTVLTLNKPIYVDFSILDLSKWFMYIFHYKYTKNKFDAELLFTDTYSLVNEIKTGDICEDFYQKKKICLILVIIHYIPSLFEPINKKVIGKMKDEFRGKIISEFVVLKLKMYSLVSADNKEVTKARIVNKKIRHK